MDSNTKLGIVTIFRAENYGAVLQCYALKKYLTKFYQNVTIVNYASKADRIGYNILYNGLLYNHRYLHYLIYLLKLPLFLNKKILRKKLFQNFINTHLCPLSSTSDYFDCLIYGSDQILIHYGKYFGGYDNVYWGDLLNSSKKIMYAASMGIIKSGTNDYITNHLKNFTSIAVREKKLADFLSQFTDKPIEVVVDPTLLLDIDDWNDFCIKERIVKEKYILVYNLNKINIVDKIADELSHQNRIKIINIYGNPRMYEDVYSKSTYSPIEFVTLFRDAEYVVTSSFHGTVFSLIFKKQFYVSQKNNVDRVLNILEHCDLQSRFIHSFKDFKNVHCSYDNMDNKMKELRLLSENYLKSNI